MLYSLFGALILFMYAIWCPKPFLCFLCWTR